MQVVKLNEKYQLFKFQSKLKKSKMQVCHGLLVTLQHIRIWEKDKINTTPTLAGHLFYQQKVHWSICYYICLVHSGPPFETNWHKFHTALCGHILDGSLQLGFSEQG